jgi:hypothetical protein
MQVPSILQGDSLKRRAHSSDFSPPLRRIGGGRKRRVLDIVVRLWLIGDGLKAPVGFAPLHETCDPASP